MSRRTGFMLLVIVNVLCFGVLSFHQTGAAQSGTPPTLANPVETRREMLSKLDEIATLLKEQNALLRSGDVKVSVTELAKKK